MINLRGHIRKRGNKWYIVVDLGKDTSGDRQQKWFSGYNTRTEAEADLPRILSELQKGFYVNTENMKLSDYLEYWHETYCKVNLAPSTLKRYKIFVN
jgi:hypothetical protein